jgi:hypothetical protein
MSAAWPPMPAWLRLDVAPARVARGASVRVRWAASDAPDGHELRLALVVHHKVKLTTLDLDVPGKFGAERQLWQVPDRVALDGEEARLRVPDDAPYSYPGTVLAFFWGIALARSGDPIDTVLGWSALQVLP